MILSASAISTTVKKVSLTTAGIASFMALSTAGANASAISGTIINTNVGLGNGVPLSQTFTGVFSASDTLTLNASGTINTFAPFGETLVTNAAGISTIESDIGPGATTNTSSPFNVGSLLISNDNINFQQVFASSEENGFGSEAPLENLSRTATLADIFGSGFTTASSLQFKVEPYTFSSGGGDAATVGGLNSSGGSFASVPNVYTLTGSISQASGPVTDVPEPFTIVGTLIGGTAALRMRKKLKANNN
jgi:hypothetical protein